MADEVTDSSNQEQLVICIRWVDHSLEVREDLIGMYNVDNITSNTIVASLTDALLRMNIHISKCRGQFYDGASNMVGLRTGVSTQLKKRGIKSPPYTLLWTLTPVISMRYSKKITDFTRCFGHHKRNVQTNQIFP